MVAERVMTIVADTKRIPRESVTLDSTFEELGIDSLTGIEVIYALEEEFNISIPNDVAQEIRSVRQAVEKLEPHVARSS